MESCLIISRPQLLMHISHINLSFNNQKEQECTCKIYTKCKSHNTRMIRRSKRSGSNHVPDLKVPSVKVPLRSGLEFRTKAKNISKQDKDRSRPRLLISGHRVLKGNAELHVCLSLSVIWSHHFRWRRHLDLGLGDTEIFYQQSWVGFFVCFL